MLYGLAKIVFYSFIGGVVVGLIAALLGYPITPELITELAAQGLGYVRMYL